MGHGSPPPSPHEAAPETSKLEYLVARLEREIPKLPDSSSLDTNGGKCEITVKKESIDGGMILPGAVLVGELTSSKGVDAFSYDVDVKIGSTVITISYTPTFTTKPSVVPTGGRANCIPIIGRTIKVLISGVDGFVLDVEGGCINTSVINEEGVEQIVLLVEKAVHKHEMERDQALRDAKDRVEKAVAAIRFK